MVEIRPKGDVPLAHPDPKPAEGFDLGSGYVYVAYLDLQARRYAVWAQPVGWITPDGGLPYGDVSLTGWTGFMHDGHLKLTGTTWAERDPDGRPDMVIIDFGAMPGAKPL